MARANGSGTFTPGAYCQLICGEIECRMRDKGPMPGKKAKKVGEMPAKNWSRLLCCTYSPPVNWSRIMNGPAPVAFTVDTPGCSFQVLGKNDGRLMPVCQSTRVSNVCPKSARRTPPVLSGS